MRKKLLQSLLFVLLTLFSPFFWLLVKNPAAFLVSPPDFFQPKSERLIYEVNTLQGEAKKAGVGFLGRLVVNKYTWVGREMLSRVAESFDPHFLFFEGDLEVKRSTKASGLVYLCLLPMVLYCFSKLLAKKQFLTGGLFLMSAMGSALIEPHYHALGRIPLALIFNFLAASGIIKFFSSKGNKSWKFLYLVLLLWEVLGFFHDFYNHYPSRLGV